MQTKDNLAERLHSSSLREKVLFYLHNPLRVLIVPITWLPYFSFIRKTSDYQCAINFWIWFLQKVLNIGGNRRAYWPVHWTSKVFDADRILVGIDAYPGYMQGCYIQGMGGISIGDYTQVAPNVVIVSANHDLYDSRLHISEPVTIGKYCWIGAGAKIMPGVNLGDWTVVGAGAVVTKSFTEGYCVIGGVPAKVISFLDRQKCIPFHNKVEYRGYIRADRFEDYRRKFLEI
jgi:acetyltransferase-like isoleucine patch superfamily enzyme